MKNRKGFSLIELLVVVALLPIVAMAIYGNFRSAVSIWKQATVGIVEEDLAILDGKLERDLKNTFRYTGIGFIGNDSAFSTATFISGEASLGGPRAIGLVKYSYDSGKKAILREERNIHEIYKEKTGRVSVVLSGVSNFEIAYFLLDPQYKKFSWRADWPTPNGALPIAVRFKFNYNGPKGPIAVSKTFYIPVGGA